MYGLGLVITKTLNCWETTKGSNIQVIYFARDSEVASFAPSSS